MGLHSGKPVKLQILPAPANAGITFLRVDLPSTPAIKAHYQNISQTQRATTLGSGKSAISTVEHLLAALNGAGIDNALVEIDGSEVPVLDGSSQVFLTALETGGLVTQLKARNVLLLKRRIEIKLAEKWAVAEPSDCMRIHASIDWDHPSIGFQEFHYTVGVTPFSNLASARTFGFVRELEALKRAGLARGGSLDCAVVLGDALVLNPEGLRYPDEFVRHKVLDAIGDFKLSGFEIVADIRLHRAGHDLHNQLLLAIFSNPENYAILPAGSQKTAVSSSNRGGADKKRTPVRVPAVARVLLC